jgi:gas vesicle protein
MSKKKTHGRKGERTPPRTTKAGNPTAEAMGSYVRSNRILQDTWNDFSEQMETRISESYQNQQKTYQDFYNKWMKFNEKMGSRIGKTDPGDKYREAYDVWKNYATRMNHRLGKMMTTGKETYKRLDKQWQDHSNTIGQDMVRFSNGDIKPHEFKGMHDAWNGFSGEMREYIESTTDTSTEDLGEITDVWLDFSKRMGDFVKDLGEDGKESEEFTSLWMDTSKEIGHSLQKMLKENNVDFEKLQKTWFDYCSKMEKEMVNTSKNMGWNYDDLWDAYFDNQKTWYGWWSSSLKQENNGLKKTIDDLKRRLDDLEKKKR